MSNYLELVMTAVSKSMQVGSVQQLADAVTTETTMNMEQNIYKNWLGQMSKAGKSIMNIEYLIAHSSWTGDPNYAGFSKSQIKAVLQEKQAQYQNLQTEQQTYTQQADSMVQAEQNQVSQDGASKQQILQCVSSIKEMLASLSNLTASN